MKPWGYPSSYRYECTFSKPKRYLSSARDFDPPPYCSFHRESIVDMGRSSRLAGLVWSDLVWSGLATGQHLIR
jgi:hypothetical protein